MLAFIFMSFLNKVLILCWVG